MLDNAIKYKEELKIKLMDIWYDDKYKYYFSSNWRSEFELPKDDWERRCYVSLDKEGNVIGYIAYSISRLTNSAYDFGAINFSDNKTTFGIDLCKVIDDIFCKFNMTRIEFNVVCSNPIEKSYDKMIAKYGGRIVGTRKKVVKLIDNQIYDDKIYEILREDYLTCVK